MQYLCRLVRFRNTHTQLQHVLYKWCHLISAAVVLLVKHLSILWVLNKSFICALQQCCTLGGFAVGNLSTGRAVVTAEAGVENYPLLARLLRWGNSTSIRSCGQTLSTQHICELQFPHRSWKVWKHCSTQQVCWSSAYMWSICCLSSTGTDVDLSQPETSNVSSQCCPDHIHVFMSSHDHSGSLCCENSNILGFLMYGAIVIPHFRRVLTSNLSIQNIPTCVAVQRSVQFYV